MTVRVHSISKVQAELTYPVILLYNGNPDDAVCFVSPTVGIRVGAAKPEKIGTVFESVHYPATHRNWQRASAGSSFTFTQD